MGTDTNIEWARHTFNPWTGCTKISPGCKNCYAAAFDKRHFREKVEHWGPGAPRLVATDKYWKYPARWARQAKADGSRARVFTASLADIFDAEAPIEERRRLWRTIEKTCENLDWIIVTKRPERIFDVMAEDDLPAYFFLKCGVWLVISAENQKYLAQRIPWLMDVPAAVHGISAEPLLGVLDLSRIEVGKFYYDFTAQEPGLYRQTPKNGKFLHIPIGTMAMPYRLEWAICGGESGIGARIMPQRAAEKLLKQCQIGNIPFFMKQMGSKFGPHKGADIPGELMVRQYPVPNGRKFPQP